MDGMGSRGGGGRKRADSWRIVIRRRRWMGWEEDELRR